MRKCGPNRREILKAGTLGLLAFKTGSVVQLLRPAAARAAGIPYQTLTNEEALLLEAFGEALLPGAKEAGLAHFVDQQISADPANSLLFLRYMDVPPPYADFYRAGLAGLDTYSRQSQNAAFYDLGANEAHGLIGEIAGTNPPGWQGPPSPFFYFVARADAVDVVYGTVDGFKNLDIPYMAHLEPETKW